MLAWRGAASADLDSSADKAYMKALVLRSDLWTKCPEVWPHSRKLAGQRATVKAKMKGFASGLGRRPPSR